MTQPPTSPVIPRSNAARFQPWTAVLVLIALAVVVFALSVSAVWLGDDTFFSFHLGAGDWMTRIEGLRDIIASQLSYYKTNNGRFVTHCMVQFFCAIGGQQLFAVCNAVVWVLFVLGMARVAGFSLRNNAAALCAIALLSFICFRTQFTPPCQINYIWAMTASMFVAHYYLNMKRISPWAVVPLVAFSFLAGWGQESLSSGMAAAMWIYALCRFRSMQWQRWLMLIAYTVGMLLLCLAPSNFSRLGVSSLHVTPVAIAYYMRVGYLLAAVLLYLLIIKRVPLVSIYRDNAFWFNALLFMLLFNFIVRVYCNRQLFGADAVSLVLALRLAGRYSLVPSRGEVMLLSFMALLFVQVAVEDLITISHRAAVVDKLQRLYDESPDGVVYCDISDEDYCYHDEDAMYSVNNWSLIQLSHAWQVQNRNKPLQWRPVAVKQYVGKRLPSQVIRLDDRENIFLLVHDKQDSCAYDLFKEWRYGPFLVVRSSRRYHVSDFNRENNPSYMNDSTFEAVIWRQHDVFLNFVDARLVQGQDNP